jgi:hypothetical protein
MGDPKFITSSSFRASEGTLSHWSQLHLQSLAHTNLHWARVLGYGQFSLSVIHKEVCTPAVRILRANDDVDDGTYKKNWLLYEVASIWQKKNILKFSISHFDIIAYRYNAF